MFSPPRPTRFAWFQLGWAISTISLLGFTYPLWFAPGDFPQIPLFSWARQVPANLDQLVSGLVLIALTAAGWFALRSIMDERVTRNTSRMATATNIMIVAGFALLFATNQHRLQPWAYLAGLAACAALLPSDRTRVVWMRALVISIYVYSAISKVDFLFLNTLGQQFLAVITDAVGIDLKFSPPATRRMLALGFPLAELLIGIGFAFPMTRRIAVLAAIAMHTVLIAVLSPWGLNHKPAVLIWNAFFVWQAVSLFWRPLPVSPDDSQNESPAEVGVFGRVSGILAGAVILAAILLPLGRPWGWYDHWTSWGLYAPNHDRIMAFVSEAAAEKLPATSIPFVEPAQFGDSDFEQPVRRVRIDVWSLEQLGVPIYPQTRFQLGVVSALANVLEKDAPSPQPTSPSMHVILESQADRMNGSRNRLIVDGLKIHEGLDSYRLNGKPRED